MKKNKIISVIAILAFTFTVLTGCGSDPIAEDVINYINIQMPTIAELEDSFLTSLDSMAENEDMDIPTLILSLKDEIIPNCDKLIEGAKKIIPETEEVAALHDKYIEAMTKQNSGFVKMKEGLEDNINNETVEQGGTIVDEGNAEYTAYVDELDALATEHGVELE